MDCSGDKCGCVYDLANLIQGYTLGDRIRPKICLDKEREFCGDDQFKVGDESEKRNIPLEPCYPDYDIYMKFTSLSYEDLEEESSSQDLLDLKEDDYLRLDYIYIKNVLGGCYEDGWKINFIVINPEIQRNYPFGIRSIDMPPLKENETYSLILNESKDSFPNSYIAYKNNEKIGTKTERGVQQLFWTGVWEIKAFLDRGYNDNLLVEDAGKEVGILFSNGEIYTNSVFKVKPKGEKTLIEDSSVIKHLTWVMAGLTIVIAILTFLLIIIESKKIGKTFKSIWKYIKKKQNYFSEQYQKLLKKLKLIFPNK